jgi:hypothetical protein
VTASAKVYGIRASLFSSNLVENVFNASATASFDFAKFATKAISLVLIPRPFATATFCSEVKLFSVSLLVKSAIKFAVSSVIVLCDDSSEGTSEVRSGSEIRS